MGEACITHEGEENCIRILSGKPERKRRPIKRWERNIVVYFKETGWDGMKRSDLAQDADKY
jgi:hypothetical protein